MENLADDPSFIDRIVHEVKSQGLFDQFRKECLADVDTKPAYQNLRQRVETSVSKFLAQQKWTDNIRHKNQLRDKLRKHIIDSGFLETGVERIVDQVVNPKISTVFHPKVEEIVYNYLGIEKPKTVVNGAAGNSSLDIQTDFLPEDLEAVSPDSDKKSSSTSPDPPNAVEPHAIDDLNESKENVDDFESPAFEPLEIRPPSQVLKHDSNDSHASVISGLTSQDSVESENLNDKNTPVEEEAYSLIDQSATNNSKAANGSIVHDGSSAGSQNVPNSPLPVLQSPEIVQNDSQLSQVSSNSRLSIITNSEGTQQQQAHLPSPGLDITEEAQMPKFNENSNEEGEILDSSDDQTMEEEGKLQPQKSNFDLHKEAYEFRGTERNRRFLDTDSSMKGSRQDAAADNDLNRHQQDIKSISPIVPVHYEENSSHSERSLRICEDSTLEQHKIQDMNSHMMETCDSAKTPLNDEHSTQSAPDADKLENSPPAVVTLTAIHNQQLDVLEKKSDRSRREHHHESDRNRKHHSSHRHHSSSSSSSRDKKSHSSSKHHRSSGGSSSSNSSSRQDRKNENGKRSSEKKREEDDHYSSHDKSSKKRRSTDRDSNDGADGSKAPKSGSSAGMSRHTSERMYSNSSKTSREMEKRHNESQSDQINLNESLESSFEGFDEEKVSRESEFLKANMKGKVDSVKKSKKRKSDGLSDRKPVLPQNMDVFAFSFDKPAKLGENSDISDSGEQHPEGDLLLREQSTPDTFNDSIDNLEEGVILLKPMEIEKVTIASQEVTSSTDELALPEETILKPQIPETDPSSLVTLVTQPVVVDQMLTNGDDMDLELLIGEKQLVGDESSLVTIQKGLDTVKNKVRKPKIASNFNEARKLMKVRKHIDREEKKKREQAILAAKKLITENGIKDADDQGIELEFVCDENNKSSGPIISSPVRPKSKPNNDLEEDELQYFPEVNEVFAPNLKLLETLRQKTPGKTFANDFVVEFLAVKLFSLAPPSVRTFSLDKEANDSLAVEIKHTGEFSGTFNPSELCEMDPTKQLKVRTASIDSDIEPEMESVVQSIRYSDTSMSEKPEQSNQKGTDFKDSSSETKSQKAKVKESKSCLTKVKRVGLAKPKTITLKKAILTVDIAEVNSEMAPSEKPSPTAAVSAEVPNNNNGVIKSVQRYSSDELYRPRTLNGLRTKTRTRASEVGGV
ncbi:biorientation of chromosomes in cell division protein 1-like 1 [Uranotaenia lowii]|uniref:biorientation of chromosomes in cell division protein 1-like 1 n=1 Tax=Uranotaenia lowii TaxID=190385 RepID=UPI00247AB4E7|nr:biorientation of chromosomes in cell division protein 1-like 1 [Uranotaenia lowii]